MHRREFLVSAACGIAGGLASCSPVRPGPQRTQRILVLGGTNFVGPAIVERAMSAGHEVTLFNRGITRPHLFPGLEKLVGSRAVDGGDLGALHGRRRWDAVIDVWPYQSALVEQTARLLADRADYYFYCSSIAVYRDFSRPGLNETSEIHVNDPGWYGGEKALAERAVATYFPTSSGISRCHAILGPRDDGHSYHYWLRRLASEDEVLAPGTGRDPVQYVDVRDVADWVVGSVETDRTGIYNLTGPAEPLELQSFLERTRSGIGSNADLVWVDADFLRQTHGVASFTDLPLWAPLDEDEGFYQVDGSKAISEGMTYRPVEQTARDAWRWHQSHFFRDAVFPVGGLGMAREREEAILAAWSTQR